MSTAKKQCAPLPPHILQRILSNRPVDELLKLRKVCRRWKMIADRHIPQLAKVPPLKFVVAIEMEQQDLMTDHDFLHPIRCHVFRLTKYGEEPVDYDVDFKWATRTLTEEEFWEVKQSDPQFLFQRYWTIMSDPVPATPIQAYRTKLPVRAPNGKIYMGSVLSIKKTSELADAYRWGQGPEIDLQRPLVQYQYDAQDRKKRQCARPIRLLIPSARAPSPLKAGMRPPYVSVKFIPVSERHFAVLGMSKLRMSVPQGFYLVVVKALGDEDVAYGPEQPPMDSADPLASPAKMTVVAIYAPDNTVLYSRSQSNEAQYLELSNTIPVNYVTRSFPYYGNQ